MPALLNKIISQCNNAVVSFERDFTILYTLVFLRIYIPCIVIIHKITHFLSKLMGDSGDNGKQKQKQNNKKQVDIAD